MRTKLPAVLILDDSVDLCEVLNQLIAVKLGVTCVCANSFDDLVQQRTTVLATRTALLDVNLGEGSPNGIDAYHWLRSEKYTGEILFLTGHARDNPLLNTIVETGVKVLAKPCPTPELIAAIGVALDRVPGF